MRLARDIAQTALENKGYRGRRTKSTWLAKCLDSHPSHAYLRLQLALPKREC